MMHLFADLSPKQIEILPPDLTVFLFPIGGLEDHGSHLPVGVKLVHAELMAQQMAESLTRELKGWTTVVMPALPLTVDTVTSKTAIAVRPHVLRDAVVDQCESLKRMGFLNFCTISSHLTPRQITALEDAAGIISKRKWFGMGQRALCISLSSALVESKSVFESPMIGIPFEHGGALDTGLVMMRGKLQGSLAELPERARPKASIGRFFAYFQHRIEGYWGTPQFASAEQSQAWLKKVCDQLAAQAAPLLQRGKSSRLFRSSYRLFPFNGSFFKAYLLATFFFVLMMVWIMWSLKDVFDAR